MRAVITVSEKRNKVNVFVIDVKTAFFFFLDGREVEGETKDIRSQTNRCV